MINLNRREASVNNLGVLYKFASLRVAREILESGRVKITNPLHFNDPFDCNIPAINVRDVDLLDIIKKEMIDNCPVSLSREERRKLEKHLCKGKLKAENRGSNKEIYEELRKLPSLWDENLGRLRVLSLTDRRDSILMWSHYADSHRGVALHFDYMSPVFSLARKVKYERQGKGISLFIKRSVKLLARKIAVEDGEQVDRFTDELSKETLDALVEYLLIKKIEWAYENEYRVILPSDADLVVKDRQLDMDFVNFDAKSLKGVTFGACASQGDQGDIEKIKSLMESKYPDAKLREAKKEGWDLLL